MDERTHARYMSDIAYFLSKMEAEPNSSYFIPIALAYNKLEKYDETIAMCKTAIERFPSNCAAKTFLAEAYVYKGLFDQARELLFDVTAEDDNNYKALKLLGIICKEKGDTTEALKYLTGAFIRAPEDEEVRKMIDELGGTLNPGEIYDERMKRQSQSVADDEEDEDLKTYQEIDNRIRNAEIIMADLVSDTTISARNYDEEEDFHSDDPNDYMPLITKHEDEEEETLSDDPNDFLPTINKAEPEKEENSENKADENQTDEKSEDLAGALNENQEDKQESEEEKSTDDLLAALNQESDESAETSDKNLDEENKADEESNDLVNALSGNQEEKTENKEDTSTDDLLAALNQESDESVETSDKNLDEENNDLVNALSETQEEKAENKEDTSTDDLLAALNQESDESAETSDKNLDEENTSDEENNDLVNALSGNQEEKSENKEDTSTDDLLAALNQESDESAETSDKNLDEENKTDEENNDLVNVLSENQEEKSETENIPETASDIETENGAENKADAETGAESKTETEVENEIETDSKQSLDEAEQFIINNDKAHENETLANEETDDEHKQLLSKKVPSSIGDMTYDDMIDDDFQYGKIVDDSYKDKDSENANVDLGESAPFTQGNIMDEILSAVGMTQDDMADDERIDTSEKDRKLMRLENFLEKIQHNKESK